MLVVHVALCATLIFTHGDAARPTSQETESLYLHHRGQLSKVNQRSEGPHDFQNKLRTLDNEFGQNQPSLIDENEQQTKEVMEQLQGVTNKSKMVPQAYANFSGRADQFKEKLSDQHAKLDTIMQRHFKWHGKPVWHGPLRSELDDLDGDQIREYIVGKKDRSDIKAKHIIDERGLPLINFPATSDAVADEAEASDADEVIKPSTPSTPKDEPRLPPPLEFPSDPVARQFAIEWYKEMIEFPVKIRKKKFASAMKYWIPKNAAYYGHDVEDAEFVYKFFQDLKAHYLRGEDLDLEGAKQPTARADDDADEDDEVSEADIEEQKSKKRSWWGGKKKKEVGEGTKLGMAP